VRGVVWRRRRCSRSAFVHACQAGPRSLSGMRLACIRASSSWAMSCSVATVAILGSSNGEAPGGLPRGLYALRTHGHSARTLRTSCDIAVALVKSRYYMRDVDERRATRCAGAQSGVDPSVNGARGDVCGESCVGDGQPVVDHSYSARTWAMRSQSRQCAGSVRRW